MLRGDTGHFGGVGLTEDDEEVGRGAAAVSPAPPPTPRPLLLAGFVALGCRNSLGKTLGPVVGSTTTWPMGVPAEAALSAVPGGVGFTPPVPRLLPRS